MDNSLVDKTISSDFSIREGKGSGSELAHVLEPLRSLPVDAPVRLSRACRLPLSIVGMIVAIRARARACVPARAYARPSTRKRAHGSSSRATRA